MHPADALRVFDSGSERSNGKRGRIRCEDGCPAEAARKFSEHPALDLQVFDNRLDRDSRASQFFEFLHSCEPANQFLALLWLHSGLLDKFRGRFRNAFDSKPRCLLP